MQSVLFSKEPLKGATGASFSCATRRWKAFGTQHQAQQHITSTILNIFSKILKRFIEINDLFNERNFHDFGTGDFVFFKFKKSQSPQCRSRGNFFRSINHLFQKSFY